MERVALLGYMGSQQERGLISPADLKTSTAAGSGLLSVTVFGTLKITGLMAISGAQTMCAPEGLEQSAIPFRTATSWRKG